MNEARRREKVLFEAALAQTDAAARQAFLVQACGDDDALLRRLEKLLAVQDRAEAFLVPPPPPSLAASESGTASESPSAGESQTRIGPYRILRRLGAGGCGVVYLAEQHEPVRRQVALKIIRLGMDTENVIARFELERQALAMMDHPNIARVLDAGATDTGRPYFVMELVRGIKITDYCAQNRLTTEQRLQLFIRVCHAVQHAHQKGIIHRDLKPSNILVASQEDGVPVPKIIDFGIAKAIESQLGDDTGLTPNIQLVGTPAYMSPEQAILGNPDLDTRSDIYSLGALLHELLTGRPPFETQQLLRAGVGEMHRIIREREVPRPSATLAALPPDQLREIAARHRVEGPRLLAAVRGDLDWIVTTTLEKDRRRRYDTANGLAMDIRRFLNHELVSARPPSRVYRLQKLVRRNRAVFVSGTLVLLALLAGLGASTWMFLRERDARREQARLREVAERARANEAALRRLAESRETISHAAVLISHSELAEADTLMAAIPPDLLQPSLECANVLRSLGEWHALANRWDAASARHEALAAVITRADASDSDDVSRSLLPASSAVRENGRAEDYERFRQAAITRFADTTNPIPAEQVIKASLLGPADNATLARLAPLAALVADTVEGNDPQASRDPYMDAWRCFALSLFEHRGGNYERSLAWAGQCLAYRNSNAPRRISINLLLAMACHHLGREEEARVELAYNRRLVEERFRTPLVAGNPAQGFWFDWINARILLREATALIDP